MKVGIVQMNIVWGDSVANQRCAEQFIERNLIEAEIIILPEMFSTGFSMRPDRIAEPMSDSPTLRWLVSTAKRYGKAIVGSIAIKDGDLYYNRLFFVKDSGEYQYYDKRHLFRMAGEDRVYHYGDERLVVDYKGIRFLPLVCYDLRFPVWSRIKEQDYDVILYIASWPDARIYAWDTLLRARAIENISYVVGVNRVGDDKLNHYNGHSVVLDYMGIDMAFVAEDVEGVATVDIDIDKLRQFRADFPAHLDSD